MGRKRRRGRLQAGMTLIEVLISIVVIALVLGAASTGIIMLNRTTAAANNAARANVLITGFGEALKRVPYVECSRGNLDDEYNAEFVDYQASLPVEQRLLKTGETAEVTDVAVNCIPIDPGVQTISFTVTVGKGVALTKTRTAEIVKRNPDYVNGLFPSFTACRLTSLSTADSACVDGDEGAGKGDALAIFQMDASSSSPIARILQYSYECNDDEDTVVVVTQANASNALCDYLATATTYTRSIVLTITDQAGRTATTSQTVTIPAVQEARLAPTPVIKASCAPTPSAQCTSGTANPSLVVSFDGSGSSSLQGNIVSYKWDFGDVDSGQANTATGATASHTFSRTNNYAVKLTVTDEIGVSATATLTIAVTRPGPPPPVARFTYSPNPAVAPQTIAYDGSGSTNAAGGAVATYQWNFGDSTTSSEEKPKHLYNNPGTYTVTLTVLDGSGVSSSVSQQVVIGTFQAKPSDFRLTDASGCLLGLFCRGHFYFAWTNGARSSTDTLDYEIQIRYVSGACFGFNTESKLARAGAPGSVQAYDYVVGSASDVCIWNTYEWRVRSIRSNADIGSITSAWSSWSSWTINRLSW